MEKQRNPVSHCKVSSAQQGKCANVQARGSVLLARVLFFSTMLEVNTGFRFLKHVPASPSRSFGRSIAGHELSVWFDLLATSLHSYCCRSASSYQQNVND